MAVSFDWWLRRLLLQILKSPVLEDLPATFPAFSPSVRAQFFAGLEVDGLCFWTARWAEARSAASEQGERELDVFRSAYKPRGSDPTVL